MFEKNLRIAYLLDFYGETLDEHTLEVMRSYYNDDLSLSEIASGFGVSRQGIRHVIKKGEERLEFLEATLKLAKRHEELIASADELAVLAASLEKREGESESVKVLRKAIGTLLKGN